MTIPANTTAVPARPLPPSNPLSEPYWRAARQGHLLLQRCASCHKIRHYPRLLCDHCYVDRVEWIEASGRGKVHSWTVCHHAFHPAYAIELPYTLVTIDLEEGVRALGRWHSQVKPVIGLRVSGHFAPHGDSVELAFQPTEDIGKPGSIDDEKQTRR